MSHTTRWTLIVCAMTAFLVVVWGGVAFGYLESQPYPAGPYHDNGNCYDCHTNECGQCHSSHLNGPAKYWGPHGEYSTATSKCEICHTIHVASGTLKLLPGNTVKAVCETCHDGTGGNGVYGAIAARGLTVGGGHSIDATNVVPGGDRLTGGSAVATFTGENNYLTCDDCHSPHDSNTVVEYFSDRRRSARGYSLQRNEVPESSKLLRQQPTSASTATPEYGSDWCLGCHGGRLPGTVHNHPVESSETVASYYVYRNVPVVNSDSPTSQTVLGQLGGRPSARGSGNRGYLMPYPRTAQQSGHYPLCQQCHEDSRDVGDLTAAGLADAEPSVVTTLDGRVASDNPRFQNFPHETVNENMLVETGDDLCLNCHPVSGLP
ncbi:MAG: hypothetical protein Kow0056_13470 [Coriobacteriia bacterium]